MAYWGSCGLVVQEVDLGLYGHWFQSPQNPCLKYLYAKHLGTVLVRSHVRIVGTLCHLPSFPPLFNESGFQDFTHKFPQRITQKSSSFQLIVSGTDTQYSGLNIVSQPIVATEIFKVMCDSFCTEKLKIKVTGDA